MSKSSVSTTIDLDADGRHIGDICIRWSDNSVPLGYHPVPIISIRNGDGPTALLIAGTHGDEFEGPSALMRLVRDIAPEDITGQIIIVPALNAPAVRASSRVSPLDGVNLNRAFPGDPMGSISDQIAYYIETELLPRAHVAIDLHSGGKASVFAPCSLPTRTADPELYEANLNLAQIFGLPLIWVLGGFNDHRSLNSAAERAKVPMIATELGGGGAVDPKITDATEQGLLNILRNQKILPGTATPTSPRKVEILDPSHSLYAPAEGVFDRKACAGQDVKAGDIAGTLHYVLEPRRPSEVITFPHDGHILAHTNRGYVEKSDMLMIVVRDVD